LKFQQAFAQESVEQVALIRWNMSSYSFQKIYMLKTTEKLNLH